MIDLNFLRLSDIDLQLARRDALLQQIGCNLGDIERFLSVWGVRVANRRKSSRPKGVLFILKPSYDNDDIPIPTESAIDDLLDTLMVAQTKQEILKVQLDGKPIERIQIPRDLRRRISGGQWTVEQASLVSKGSLSEECICLAVGRSFWVFVEGVTALTYTDAKIKAIESTNEIFNRQGWDEDGELLVLCGKDDLCNRSRSGIWHMPDLFILRRRPEELIQDRLQFYLEKTLTGFVSLRREEHIPNEGRVDLVVVLADNTTYFIEVKWIGRSINKRYQLMDETQLKKEMKRKWDCKYVMALNENNGYRGVAQLSYYLHRTTVSKGYLVVYDCRHPTEARDLEAANDYPKSKELKDYQYKILHVAVDPRTASQKAKVK